MAIGLLLIASPTHAQDAHAICGDKWERLADEVTCVDAVGRSAWAAHGAEIVSMYDGWTRLRLDAARDYDTGKIDVAMLNARMNAINGMSERAAANLSRGRRAQTEENAAWKTILRAAAGYVAVQTPASKPTVTTQCRQSLGGYICESK